MEIGKLAVQKEMKADMCKDVKPSQKKKKYGLLGPRGLKKNGGYNYGGLAASNDSGEDQRVGGLALVERSMKQEGYGVFPRGFEPPLFKSKKTFQYVTQDTYTTVTLDCYKLALSGVGVERPKFFILNPISQGMPLARVSHSPGKEKIFFWTWNTVKPVVICSSFLMFKPYFLSIHKICRETSNHSSPGCL